jgi:hypothetical protein
MPITVFFSNVSFISVVVSEDFFYIYMSVFSNSNRIWDYFFFGNTIKDILQYEIIRNSHKLIQNL